VVSLEQLLSIGYSYEQVRGLVARGHLHRLFRGAFAVGHRNVGRWGWLKAAELAAGDGAFLSHRTAAAARGLREISTRQIEVTVAGGRTHTRGRLVVHRTKAAPHRDEIAVVNGIRVSSLARMFIELAPRERPSELERLITQSARKQILDIDAVERELGRHPRRPGVAMLRSAFRRYRPGPDRKSDLERAFDRALERNPDIPEPEKNVVIDGWELDNYWPRYRLDVELDGRPYHVAVADIEKDRFRDAKLLTRRRIQTLRFTDFRIEWELADCLDDIRAFMRDRGALAG
jgi:very-short-patch-repair endonuclease